MLLGPIFSVEMVTSVRRARYFFIRVAYAAILLVFLVTSYNETAFRQSFTGIQQTANVAAHFFFSFAVLQILAVLLLGPAITAGTIAMERERRTIEYLFATDLSNGEIVLGKLLARVLHITCVVLVGLPILSIAMLMGGIAPDHLAITFVVTISTMVAVAVLSIAISVWAQRSRDAIMRVYVVLFGMIVLPSIVHMLLWWAPFLPAVALIFQPIDAANPLWCLSAVLRGGQSGQSALWDPVWALVRNQMIFAVLVTPLSVVAVRRVHLNAAGKAPKAKKVSLKASKRRRHQLGDYPVLWKEAFIARAAGRRGLVARAVAFLLAVAALIAAAVYFPSARPADFLGVTLSITALFGCGGLLLMGGRAAGLVAHEKDKDTWVTLLSTPLAPREIVLGKIVGNVLAFRWLAVLLGIVWLLQIAKTPGFVLPALFTAATLTVLAFYASTLGVLYSLKARNSVRALGATLATLVFVGGGYLMCCMVLLFTARGNSEMAQLILAPCIPFLTIYPGEEYMFATQLPRGFGRAEAAITMAYFIGNIGYGVAVAMLYSAAVGGFGRFSGRLEPRLRAGAAVAARR